MTYLKDALHGVLNNLEYKFVIKPNGNKQGGNSDESKTFR